VRLLGLEPSTSRLSGGCSNQLSYKRMCALLSVELLARLRPFGAYDGRF
jgi:hypothetical protein